MSKSKVEIPSFELTSTDFEPRDLVLEVDEDIPTDDVSISSKTGNKTEGDYQQWLKSLKLSAFVVHNATMLLRQRILRLGSFTSTMRLLVTKRTLQPSIEIPKRIH